MIVRDGRIVDPALPVDGRIEEIDASGCVVMAGGIDMHTHIGGGKVNLARMLLPEDHRAAGARHAEPIALPENALELASCGACAPGTLATGYRYVEMGYTSAFEPAMLPANARHAHMEMGDVPVLDHGAYVMLGSDELFLRDARRRRRTSSASATTSAGPSTPHKAMGVKVVNPGGISAFKFNQRKLDVDEEHVHWQRHAARRSCTRWRARCASSACRIRCTSTAATSAWPATSPRRWRRSPRSRACRRT